MIKLRPWLLGLAIVGMLVRFPDIAIPQVWDSSTEYAENDEYDDSFLGPLPFCVRKDAASAFASADGKIQPFICDDSGKLYTTSAGGGGGAVTNAGVFAVQEDGAALTALQLIDNLVHSINDAVGATDAVIGLGCRHKGDTVHLTTAEDDYDIVRCSNFGAAQVQPEQHHVFDALDAVGSWLILDDATENFTTTKKHVLGTDALIFDKTDGSGTFAAVIDQTISAVDLGDPSPHDLIQTVVYIPDLTEVSYVFVRLGTDDANYNEWRIPDTALTAAEFETLLFNMGDASHSGITGNGWNPAAVTYIALGVQFDGEDDALVGIIFDELSFHTNQHTSAELGAEVTSSVSTPNINILKVGNKVVNTGAGNTGTGTIRTTSSTDDINLAAIKTATEAVNTKLVTGTVIGDVNLGAVDNAVLDTMDAVLDTIKVDTEAIETAVEGTLTVQATNLDVQSGGVDLATQATLATIDTDTGNIDTSLNTIEASVAAEGAALGSGVLLQGDDGTDRKNVAVDATTGDVGVDVTNTVTVTATNLDVQSGGADLATAAAFATLDAVLDTIDAKLVTGTVIGDVNLGATDNAVLDTIDAQLDKLVTDPCAALAPLKFTIDVTDTTTTEIINESASNKVYICSLVINTDAANTVALVEDATDACADPDAGIVGGVTAAEGFQFAATSGLTMGSGRGTILQTASTDMNVCIIASASTQLTGGGTYVYAP